MARANDEFDRLADALLAANARGQKVLAMAGCCRGEGATTLLLCCLGDWPSAASNWCWSTPISAARDSPSDSACSRKLVGTKRRTKTQRLWIKQSSRPPSNNLALSGPRAGIADGPHDRRLVAAGPCLDTLKNHYEMVLVDLGPLENIESIGDVLCQTDRRRKDRRRSVGSQSAHHVGRTPWPTSSEQLTASGVALAGLIENFVAVSADGGVTVVRAHVSFEDR